jgi:hypothetical protein
MTWPTPIDWLSNWALPSLNQNRAKYPHVFLMSSASPHMTSSYYRIHMPFFDHRQQILVANWFYCFVCHSNNGVLWTGSLLPFQQVNPMASWHCLFEPQWCPLVNAHITIESHHSLNRIGKSTTNGSFSIAMWYKLPKGNSSRATHAHPRLQDVPYITSFLEIL